MAVVKLGNRAFKHSLARRQYVTTSNAADASKSAERNKLFMQNLKTQLIKNRFLDNESAFTNLSKNMKLGGAFDTRVFFEGIKSVTQMYSSSAAGDSNMVNKVMSTFKDVTDLTESVVGHHSTPVKIAVTGASGNISYSVLFRIASGQMLGANVPVILHLLEIPQAQESLKGVLMELQDCAFPLLRDVKLFDSPEHAFEDIDYAILIGSKPRSKGMERKDLIGINTKIFSEQGSALEKRAKKTCKVLVVGNPANTNCFVAASKAPSIPRENFSSMTRLDHNRGLAQLALKVNVSVDKIDGFAIWGNHSSTQYPCVDNAFVDNKPIRELIMDSEWVTNHFIPLVQNRGMSVIEARGSSSAASAANAIIDHVRDWTYGTFGKTISAGISSKGEYGITEGLIFSYPVVAMNNNFYVTKKLYIDPISHKYIEATHKELLEERDAAHSYL